MTRRTITLQGSGTMTTNTLLNSCNGNLGSPFRIPDDVKYIWSLPGSPQFPNDFYGKSYTYDDGTNPGCVAADSWFPDGLQGHQRAIGDKLRALDYLTMDSTTLAIIEKYELMWKPCVRLTSVSGITLVASTTTPLTLRDHRMINIQEAVGVDLPVEDKMNGFRWEKIVDLQHVGKRLVAFIFAGHATFAAGERPDAFIYTHNIKNNPEP